MSFDDRVAGAYPRTLRVHNEQKLSSSVPDRTWLIRLLSWRVRLLRMKDRLREVGRPRRPQLSWPWRAAAATIAIAADRAAVKCWRSIRHWSNDTVRGHQCRYRRGGSREADGLGRIRVVRRRAVLRRVRWTTRVRG